MKSLKIAERGGLAPLLLLSGIYIATRKQYKLPDISTFIPVLPGGPSLKQRDLSSEIQNAFTFHFTSQPNIGWIATLKPIHGINVPLKVWLPWDIFIAIPQINRQIGTNIQIKEKKVLGVLVGYQVYIKGVTFWA